MILVLHVCFFYFCQCIIHFGQKLILTLKMVIGRAIYNVDVDYLIFDGYINRYLFNFFAFDFKVLPPYVR